MGVVRYVMLAVSSCHCCPKKTNVDFSGLYHKLHGVHRPNSMKKSIIKRRKRVVPAMQEHNPNNPNITSFPVPASPESPLHEHIEGLQQHRNLSLSDRDPRMTDTQENPTQDQEMREEQAPPIGVDFTGYQLDQQQKASQDRQQRQSVAQMSSPSTTPLMPPSHLSLGAMPPAYARKRSHSNVDHENPSPSTPESAKTNRLSSISSLLNPAQQHTSSVSDETPIDPSLSHAAPHVKQHRHSTPYHTQQQSQLAALAPESRSRSLGSGDPGGWDKIERRSRLQREVFVLKETLRLKERELEDLSRDS